MVNQCAWASLTFNRSDRPRLLLLLIQSRKCDPFVSSAERIVCGCDFSSFSKTETKRRDIIIKIMISLTTDAMRSFGASNARAHSLMRESSKTQFSPASDMAVTRNIYSIFRFEIYLLKFFIHKRAAIRTAIECENIQIRHCSPKKEAPSWPFSHSPKRIWNLWFAFFQIVDRFRSKMKNYFEFCWNIRQTWSEREQLFRFDLNISYLIVRRSRSLLSVSL